LPDSPTPPREHRQPPLFGAVVTLVVLLLLFVGLVEGVRAIHGLGYEPAATAATTGPNLSLEVFPDSMVCHGAGGGPHPEWVTYCPSTTLKVPAYSTITVHILQYDSSTTLHNYYFSQVSGTVGGTMTVNGRTLTRINPASLAHTFTIQTPPGIKDQLFVNVPLAGTAANANQSAVSVNGNPYPRPNVITFQFKTGAPGKYVWKCYVPCGTGLSGDGLGGQDNFGGPMATTGYMAGTLTVT
jgi:hypothetical protein